MTVFDCADSVGFFREAFETSKKGNPTLTIAIYARKLGLGASSLKMILSGKRTPTTHQLLSAARALRLSPQETRHLELLGLREGARNRWEKTYYDRLIGEQRDGQALTTVRLSQKALLEDHRLIPLLVYFLESDGGEIPFANLARQLGMGEDRLRAVVDRFERDQVLARRPDGRYHVSFDKVSHRLLQKDYLKKLLREALEKIESEYESPSSLFMSYAFSTTDDDLVNLQAELKALMEKYLARPPGSKQGRQIAQACFQIYPVIRD